MADQDDRITRLEETVAHQARIIEDLSDQLADQWKVVDQTRAKLEWLLVRFATFEEMAGEAPPITKPPHY
ncbi:SlyX family protein [Rhizobium sp. RU36D]|uniref:SlyX family protein n=1 Tax=Rhizobium sp. RU36D TaxID=1907415 RepID=UPI0009D85D34|nr:SlyX family protein [Rhizobium sp. RU36D]SMD17315.1 SlyX protein [Rhizobium sp. RU36D]